MFLPMTRRVFIYHRLFWNGKTFFYLQMVLFLRMVRITPIPIDSFSISNWLFWLQMSLFHVLSKLRSLKLEKVYLKWENLNFFHFLSKLRSLKIEKSIWNGKNVQKKSFASQGNKMEKKILCSPVRACPHLLSMWTEPLTCPRIHDQPRAGGAEFLLLS